MPHYIWAGRPSFTVGNRKELKVQLFILHMAKRRHLKLSELFKTMQRVSERIISVLQCMFEEEVAEEMGASSRPGRSLKIRELCSLLLKMQFFFF